MISKNTTFSALLFPVGTPTSIANSGLVARVGLRSATQWRACKWNDLKRQFARPLFEKNPGTGKCAGWEIELPVNTQ